MLTSMNRSPKNDRQKKKTKTTKKKKKNDRQKKKKNTDLPGLEPVTLRLIALCSID